MKKYENIHPNQKQISTTSSNFDYSNYVYSSERYNKSIQNNYVYDNFQNKQSEKQIINNKINDTNSQKEEIIKISNTSKDKNEEKTEKETEYEKEQNKYKID